MMKKRDRLMVYLGLLPEEWETLNGSIRIQMGMFLFRMRNEYILQGDFYEFKPYIYGPSSVEIYEDLVDMESEKLVKHIDCVQQHRSTILEPKGTTLFKTLVNSAEPMDAVLIENLLAIKKWLKNLNFVEMINYVYMNYPDFTLRKTASAHTLESLV